MSTPREPLRFDPIEEAGRQWRSRWDEEFVTPMMAVTSVMRVHQIWLAELNEALAPHGLTFARYEALMLLYLSRTGRSRWARSELACRSIPPASRT